MIDVCQGAQAVCSKTVSLPNSCLIRTFDFVEPDRENWNANCNNKLDTPW